MEALLNYTVSSIGARKKGRAHRPVHSARVRLLVSRFVSCGSQTSAFTRSSPLPVCRHPSLIAIDFYYVSKHLHLVAICFDRLQCTIELSKLSRSHGIGSLKGNSTNLETQRSLRLRNAAAFKQGCATRVLVASTETACFRAVNACFRS